ncbi:hypothetical protein LWC34_05050 [Kibdelosporangium philippinense]|uniref:Secreted protein n=2 Tax=Kibdelosporangium philippinense TaxID=211113 RepID=A0ABS8Z2N9_9PSEU|nr:hypothetical protein [Kibdelosporangium philippinense]MCE7002196.1 hypothetical protein [Kibdelosporangium philippinense]
MANSLIRRSVAVAGVTLFLSGLLTGVASSAEAVTGTDEAVQQLRCRSRVEAPRVDNDTIRAVAATFCRDEVDVVGVRVWLQKFDRDDREWKDVDSDADTNRNARRAAARAEARCERGRYRTVAENFARDRGESFRDREESEQVRIRCR